MKTYQFAPKEWEAFLKFQKHRCPMRYQGFVNRSITVSFTETGIGCVVEVACHCGKQKNISDFSAW